MWFSEGEGGRVLFSVEVPVLVRVPGEVERVLGPGVRPVAVPVWFIEVRASEVDGAEVPAMRFAAELSLQLDGSVWADDPAYAERAGLRGAS